MEITIKVEGAENLAATLRALPAEVQAKMIPQALKAGGKVIAAYAQAEAPVRTGELAASMTVSARGQAVLVGPNKQPRNDPGDNRHMRNDSIGIFQERGTKNHFFGFGMFSWRVTAAQARRQRNKQIITVGRTEQRMKAHPFLSVALQAGAQEALAAERDKLQVLLEAKFKKDAKTVNQ